MVSDKQVKGLIRSMSLGKTLKQSCARMDISENTGRKYLQSGKLPSDLKGKPRSYRTHKDIFAPIWSEAEEYLRTDPGLEAKTLFEHLMHIYPDMHFEYKHLRSFQRRVKNWRAQHGKAREAFFPQDHHPGHFCQSDWTHMKKLNITIGGKPFSHLLYHFVLTYSGWESVDICFSESFESLSEGLQNAFFRLGGVPSLHQTDNLSAAVNNLSEKREFTVKYQSLLTHYGLSGQHTNPASPHENGCVEQLNNRFKKALEQRLIIRGSRDFKDRQEYNTFLQNLIKDLNRNRQSRVNEELVNLRELPDRRLESCSRYDGVSVTKFSTIRVLHNVYSVHSRLIKEKVNIRAYSDYLEVWHGNSFIEYLPRLRGSERHCINYRHIIDSLVKKPGAFANYRYRSDLFPTTHFKLTHDELLRKSPARADSIYLKILYYAAYNSQEYVDKALSLILETANIDLTLENVKKIAESLSNRETSVTADVSVPQTDLADYDRLFSGREVE